MASLLWCLQQEKKEKVPGTCNIDIVVYEYVHVYTKQEHWITEDC